MKPVHGMLALGLVLLAMVQYRIWLDDTGVLASQDLQQRIDRLQQDNAIQQAENDALLAEVMDLRHGNELLEEKAREELGLIKDGETFILFVDPGERD